jgi:hypothetical protein
MRQHSVENIDAFMLWCINDKGTVYIIPRNHLFDWGLLAMINLIQNW